VAACNDTRLAARAADAVVTIAARHPARAVVVVADPEAPPHMESDISLHDTGVGGQYMELVRLDVGGEAAYHLSSIVVPLLIPDIPIHLWLVGAPPLTQAFRADAVALCDSLILDTGTYPDTLGTLQLVDHELQTYDGTLALSDIAWERIRVWREAVAVAFDGLDARPWLRRVVGVDIVGLGSTGSADAWLFAGWIASRLGWPATGGPEIALSCVPAKDARSGDIAAIRIRCAGARHAARIHLERGGSMLRTSIDIDRGVVATGTSALPSWDEAQLIARLMSDAGADACYSEAVAAVNRISAQHEP